MAERECTCCDTIIDEECWDSLTDHSNDYVEPGIPLKIEKIEVIGETRYIFLVDANPSPVTNDDFLDKS